VVYAKRPFGGPQAVLAYLSRYTHRVAISNRRLISADETGVTFTWKNYRIEGPGRYQTMTLPTHEFIRGFLMHVLPRGFHRIRHYGLLASSNRAANIVHARELLAVPSGSKQPDTSEAAALDEPRGLPRPCPCCGGRMMIIETFARGCQPKHRPTSAPADRTRGPGGAPPPAISCLGAFPTPAARSRGAARHAGVRKPAHERQC
jgi:hypothetical protein